MASNYTPPNSTENVSESSTSKVKDDFLNEILMCGICLSRMTSPCCLPCAHSFCRSCLIDYAENNHYNSLSAINYILCPYCKYQLNFHSFEHFQSMLVINPVLKQLCEALDTSKIDSDQQQQQQQTQTNGVQRARCHTCGLLKMLKICKHCYFMLCDACRRTHLLDVHHESKLQLDLLESRIELINKKREEMDKRTEEYNHIKQSIDIYVQHLINEIEKQRQQAIQILDEKQHANDQVFWLGNGFDNGEKLDFFNLLVQTGREKLLAKNITDKDLMELSDNLQTMPDINKNLIELMKFTKVILEVDQNILTKQFIRVYVEQETKNSDDSLIKDDEQNDCTNS